MTWDAQDLLATIWEALGGARSAACRVEFTGSGALPSVFAVPDLAAAAIGAAGLAVSELLHVGGAAPASVTVDRRLASLWYGWSIQPVGWELPPAWDPIAGDYQTSDGWIRLHTNPCMR